MITGTYNLEANPSWALLQFQEVRLECDTTSGPVTINLPEISTLAQSTTLKLFIVDATSNASVNNITINSGSSDIFNDTTINQIILNTSGSSVEFQNVSSNQWIAIESVGEGSLTPSNKGSLMNIDTAVVISSQIPRVFSLGDFYIDPPVLVTGTTNETILSSVLVPGGTFKVGDFVSNGLFQFEASCNTVGAGTFLNTYINDTPTLSGATFVRTTVVPGQAIGNSSALVLAAPGSKAGLYITNTGFKTVNQPTLGNPATYTVTTVFDINKDMYFICSVILDNASSEVYLYSQYAPFQNTVIQTV